MNMDEKYEAIWINVEEDDSVKIVFERYFPNIEKLHVIFEEANGIYLPYSYVKKVDHQWRLPLWSQENEKAMMPTLESAKKYLVSYEANNT